MAAELPAHTKTWVISEHQGAVGDSLATDFKKTMFAVHTALLAAGMTVVRSSDSSSVAASDLWSDYTKLVWSAGAHSWMVYAWGAYEILLNLDQSTGSGRLLSARYSPSAGFTGGTTSVAAAATDEEPLGDTDGNSYNWCGSIVSSFSSYIECLAADDGSVRILVWTDTSASDAVSGFFLFESIPDTHNFADGWGAKLLAVRCVNASSGPVGTVAILSSTSAATYACQFYDGANNQHGIFTFPSYGGAAGTGNCAHKQAGADTQPYDSAAGYPLLPISVVNHVNGGLLCVFPDLYWGNDAIANAKTKEALTYPDSATERLWLQQEELVWPWTGDSTLPTWGMLTTEHEDGYAAAPPAGATTTFVMHGKHTNSADIQVWQDSGSPGIVNAPVFGSGSWTAYWVASSYTG